MTVVLLRRVESRITAVAVCARLLRQYQEQAKGKAMSSSMMLWTPRKDATRPTLALVF